MGAGHVGPAPRCNTYKGRLEAAMAKQLPEEDLQSKCKYITSLEERRTKAEARKKDLRQRHDKLDAQIAERDGRLAELEERETGRASAMPKHPASRIKTGEGNADGGSSWSDLRPGLALRREKVFWATSSWTDKFGENIFGEHQGEDPLALGAAIPSDI